MAQTERLAWRELVRFHLTSGLGLVYHADADHNGHRGYRTITKSEALHCLCHQPWVRDSEYRTLHWNRDLPVPLTYSDQTSALSVWPARRPARRSTTPNRRASTPQRTQRTTSPIRPRGPPVKVGPPPGPSSSETMWTWHHQRLSSQHRRCLLWYLTDHNQPCPDSHFWTQCTRHMQNGHPDTRPSGANAEPDWHAGTGTYDRGGDHHDRSTHSSVAYSQHSGTTTRTATSPPTIWRLP